MKPNPARVEAGIRGFRSLVKMENPQHAMEMAGSLLIDAAEAGLIDQAGLTALGIIVREWGRGFVCSCNIKISVTVLKWLHDRREHLPQELVACAIEVPEEHQEYLESGFLPTGRFEWYRKALVALASFFDLVLEKRNQVSPNGVLYLGEGVYQFGDQHIRLEDAEETVLEALVEARAASKDELISKSGVTDAVRILKRIKGKYPCLKTAINIPGGKGKGGYSTSIKAISE